MIPFFKKVFRHKEKGERDAVSSADLAALKGWAMDTVSGRAISSRVAMQLTTVFACVRVLSESMGMLPCHLYKHTQQGQDKALNHHLWRLLHISPNDYMTSQEFWELLTGCLCLRGNFYAYKNTVAGKVVELLPLHPDSVDATLEDGWNPVYRVSFSDGHTEVLDQEKIWHVRILSINGLNGLSPVSYAREAVALGLNMEEWSSQLFKNGAIGSAVLSTDQGLTNEAFNRLKQEFSEQHLGLANSHKPLILEHGLKWQQISMKAEDTQFLETRKFQKDEICAIFRVPPHMIANLDKATFSNIEHQAQSFVNYSLMPYLSRVEQRINVGLLPKKDQGRYFARFNAGALLRGDMRSRFEAYARGIGWGIYSPNDCRRLEDMNARDGGDIYLTPINMTTNPESTQDEYKTET